MGVTSVQQGVIRRRGDCSMPCSRMQSGNSHWQQRRGPGARIRAPGPLHAAPVKSPPRRRGI